MKKLLSVGLLVGLSVLGSAAATQYLAERFRYARALGEPLLYAARVPVYLPLSWYRWQRQWGPRAPKDFGTATAMAFGGALFGLGLALRLSRGSREPKPTGAYGTARWSETAELAAAGLLAERGIVLCQTADAKFRQRVGTGWTMTSPGTLIRHDGPEHALVFAPTRSGKGVGVVVPTLLAWPGSVIVYDMKRENWNITAGWRRRFSHCLRFEPTAANSVRFNPLMEVRPEPLDVRDAQNIAEILVNPDTTEEQRDHWKLTGHAFLVAVILHVLYAEADKSLAGVLKVLTDPQRHLLDLLRLMLETRHLRTGPHPAVAGGAREMLNRSENERSGVLSTAISFLELYRDPLIAANTSTSDFHLADIMCAERPVSLYLVVPPSDFDRTRPVMRLLLNFFGRRLTEHLDEVDGPGGLAPKRQRLLYLIDEFPSLGRMPFFITSLAFLAGYKIKCLLIAQSLNQLDQAYGRDNAIMDNCHVRLTYGANDERTAKRISDLIGQASLVRVQISEGKREGALSTEHVNRSYQEFGRPLKTSDELLALPFPDAVLMVGNLRPYPAKKILYYEDARFRGRAWDPATGANAPPDSEHSQRAELPEARVVPHWLTLEPIRWEPGAGVAESGPASSPHCAEERQAESQPPSTVQSDEPEAGANTRSYFDFLEVDAIDEAVTTEGA